jgi:hypothetical protein
MMSKPKELFFFDPHPGFLGAAIPLPFRMKDEANKLNGQTMPLRDAIKKFRKIAKELWPKSTWEIFISENCILLELKGNVGMRTMWRLIKFK